MRYFWDFGNGRSPTLRTASLLLAAGTTRSSTGHGRRRRAATCARHVHHRSEARVPDGPRSRRGPGTLAFEASAWPPTRGSTTFASGSRRSRAPACSPSSPRSCARTASSRRRSASPATGLQTASRLPLGAHDPGARALRHRRLGLGAPEFEPVLKGAPDNILASRLPRRVPGEPGRLRGRHRALQGDAGHGPGREALMARLRELEGVQWPRAGRRRGAARRRSKPRAPPRGTRPWARAAASRSCRARGRAAAARCAARPRRRRRPCRPRRSRWRTSTRRWSWRHAGRPRTRRRRRRPASATPVAPIPLAAVDEDFELERPYESPTKRDRRARSTRGAGTPPSPRRRRHGRRRPVEDAGVRARGAPRGAVHRLGADDPAAAGRGAARQTGRRRRPRWPRLRRRPRPPPAAAPPAPRRPPPPAARCGTVDPDFADAGRAVLQPGLHRQGHRGLPRAARARARQRAAARACASWRSCSGALVGASRPRRRGAAPADGPPAAADDARPRAGRRSSARSSAWKGCSRRCERGDG